MKKNTKSTGRNRKTARHAKSNQKPVTIDLKAEKVEPKTASEPATKSMRPTPTKAKTSVPRSARSKPVPEAKDIAEKAPNLKQSAKPDDLSQKTKPSSPSNTDRSQRPPTVNKPNAAATPNKSSGLFGKLAAGFLGGTLALGGAGALQYMGVLSSPNTETATKNYISAETLTAARKELNSRISNLESQLKQVATTSVPATAPTVDMDAINAAIDAQIKKLIPQQNTKTNTANLEKLSGQFQASNKKIETLQSQFLVTDKAVDALKKAISTGDAGETAGLVTLNKSIDTLKTKIDTVAANASNREAAIAALQSSQSAPSAGEAPSANSDELKKTITALEAKLDSLTKTAQSLADGSKQRQTALLEFQKKISKTSNNNKAETTKAIAALQSKLTALSATTKSLTTSSNERQKTIASLEKQAGKTADLNKQSANAIAAAALKNDIDRGLPFVASLNRLKSSAGDNKALSSLAAYAETGVPTIAQLTNQFIPVSEAIIKTLAPKPKEGFASRLFAGAKSLVKVRSIKPQTGSTPTALVSQITAGLASGNLSLSAKAWKALPKAGQEVSASWHEGLKARITADSLVDDALQSFLLSNSLSNTGN